MSKKKSDRRLPEEVIGLLSTIFMMPIIAAIAILTGMLLPPIASLRGLDLTRSFWLGVTTGALGVILLFLARWPLYRQRRFWTFGPRKLDWFHRRLYCLAYLFVAASIFSLVAVSLR